MFVLAGAYPGEEPCPSFANIILGWEGLPVANTLAYFALSSVAKKKKLYGMNTLAYLFGALVIKTF